MRLKRYHVEAHPEGPYYTRSVDEHPHGEFMLSYEVDAYIEKVERLKLAAQFVAKAVAIGPSGLVGAAVVPLEEALAALEENE